MVKRAYVITCDYCGHDMVMEADNIQMVNEMAADDGWLLTRGNKLHYCSHKCMRQNGEIKNKVKN